jgi:hypothetical protein
VLLLSGAGFDVVPNDRLARIQQGRLPDPVAPGFERQHRVDRLRATDTGARRSTSHTS